MLPVVTPEEMGAIDRAAPEPVEVLIGRAGAAVAREALDLLGGAYGRRVVVVAGKGNNGNDGRDAARRLRARGVRVHVVDAATAPAVLPPCDLVVDAAYGTGFRGSYTFPARASADTAVLAVDIPSGVDGLTGAAGPGVAPAICTVTFAAGKPGLYLGDGAVLAGEVRVADIGLDVSSARTHVVEAADLVRWLPARAVDAHKWRSAVWVVAGSPGMAGAATLACGGAQRAGAGYVRLSVPGGLAEGAPTEVVQVPVPATGWAGDVLAGADRFGALVVGNGLGLDPATAAEVRALVASTTIPTVVDADGLTALAGPGGPGGPGEVAGVAGGHVVLTPHDGEYARLTGRAVGDDRIDAARSLAAATGAVVLLKGPTTVVASPDGDVLLSTSGDARLATAGTGDVLAGVIGALAALGVPSFEAAAAGAFLHGAAGALGWRRGLVAGDLVELLPAVLDRLDALAEAGSGAGPDLGPGSA